jgi:hypothetical protein
MTTNAIVDVDEDNGRSDSGNNWEIKPISQVV